MAESTLPTPHADRVAKSLAGVQLTRAEADMIIAAANARATLSDPMPDVAEERARARFFTASSGQPPTDEQRAAVTAINAAVVALAVEIERHTPRSRNQSLALTALEDVSMRGNRAIFATGPTA